MKGAFECIHCGACCKKETSPVSVSFDDVHRLAHHLGRKPSDLLGKEVRLRPFLDPTEPGKLSIELGLPKPCPFWKDGRCSVYEARPLNCRLFPFWLFASLPADEVRESSLPGYDCVLQAEVDEPHRQVYQTYSARLGQRIMRESARTREEMEEGGFDRVMDVDGGDERVSVILAGPGPGTERAFTEFIRDYEARIDPVWFAGLGERLDAYLPEQADLGAIEATLDGRYVS